MTGAVFQKIGIWAWLFLVPKGEDEGIGCFRTGEKTRPISSSNADAKIIEGAIFAPLDSVLPHEIIENQRGFVGGRNLCENIVSVDHWMRIYGSKWPQSSCTLLFDFAAAFPSIVRKWLRLCLLSKGLASWYVNLLFLSFVCNEHFFRFGSGVTSGFCPKRGIKQGGPASGGLFAISIDVFLRAIIDTCPHAKLAAFADDIACIYKTCLKMRQLLPILSCCSNPSVV